MTDDDEYEEGCGFSWDHTLDVISVRDGYTTYVCRECGAEIIDGPAGERPTVADIRIGDRVRAVHYPTHIGECKDVADRWTSLTGGRLAHEVLVRWIEHPYLAGRETWVEADLLVREEP